MLRTKHGSLRRLLGAGILVSSLAFCAAVQAQDAAEIQEGGVLVVVLPGDPQGLNSALSTDTASSNIVGQIYGTLVRLDANGAVLPYMAESWDVSSDGLTYTFKLFEGIKWHDGEAFTADDVAWGLWNINKEFNGASAGLLAAVESIEAVDDLTVVFKLTYPYPPLLAGLAYPNSATILPRHIFDNGGDPRQNPANQAPIGTGPFKFVENRAGSHIELERNEDYHFEGRPYLDRLIFQVIPNEAARGLALERGDADFIPYYSMSLSEYERLSGIEGIDATIHKRTIAGEYMAFFNTRNEMLAIKEVRQALYHAVNREELLEKAAFGLGKISTGPISSAQDQFYTETGTFYDFNPELSEQLLDEAGFPRDADGKRFSIRLSYDQSEGPMNNTAQLIRAQWARIGVELQVMPMESGAWKEAVYRRWDFDIQMGTWATGPDPAIGVQGIYTCETINPDGGRNASGYCNEALDEVFFAAAQEVDHEARVALYADAVDILTADAPHMWLWDRFYPVAYSEGLVGLPGDPSAYGPFDNVGWTR
jgi:peptide/nickel transport system substrate-binding protein